MDGYTFKCFCVCLYLVRDIKMLFIHSQAESVEASPARDISRSGSEAPDPNSSPAAGKAPTSQTTLSGSKTKPTSSQKRKHSSMFFNKRKRLKTNKKNESKSGAEKSGKVGDVNDKMLSESIGEGLSDQSSKSIESSSTSENASCDKFANILNRSRLDRPDKSTCDLLADGSREVTDTPAKHSTSSSNSSAVAALSTDTLAAYKDSESCIAQGFSSAQGCNNPSSRQHQSSNVDSKPTNVIKPETNGKHGVYSSLTDCVMKAEHADGFPPENVNGAETVDRKTFSNSAVKMEIDIQNNGKNCDSVTPVKQELSRIDVKGFPTLQSNMKQEYGDRKGCKLRQQLFDDKHGLGIDSECDDSKNGSCVSKSSQHFDSNMKISNLHTALKSEGHDDLVKDSHSSGDNDCGENVLNDKECLEVKTEPVNEETGTEAKTEVTEKEEDESDEEDVSIVIGSLYCVGNCFMILQVFFIARIGVL